MKWFVRTIVYLSMFAGIRAMEPASPDVCHATVHDFFAHNNGEIARFNIAFIKALCTRLSEIGAAEQRGDHISTKLVRHIMTGELTMAQCELTEDTGFFPFLRLWHTFIQLIPRQEQNKVYLTNVRCFCHTALAAIGRIQQKQHELGDIL